jgi:hypothetical protein
MFKVVLSLVALLSFCKERSKETVAAEAFSKAFWRKSFWRTFFLVE